jgi:hypothetical protein
MTIQSVWTSPLLIGKERIQQSFLHRWIASTAASRQEKAADEANVGKIEDDVRYCVQRVC